MKNSALQVNTVTLTLTDDMMQALFNALLAQQQQAKNTQPQEILASAAPPVIPETTEKPKPKYRPHIHVWTIEKIYQKPFTISFHNVNFVSVDQKRILLPYRGKLPGEILDHAYTAALDTCYTLQEFKEMQKHADWAIQHIGSKLEFFISLQPSTNNPLMSIKVNVKTKNGRNHIESYVVDASPRLI